MNKLKKLELERDLLIIDVLTLIMVLVVSISSPAWLRIVFGLPFILFFPGYMLISILFPRKEGLSNTERPILSFGLSMAIVPIIGLILNYIWSIDLYPVLISLSFFILFTSVIAWHKRRGYPMRDRFRMSFLYRFNLPGLKLGRVERVDKLLYILLAAVILGAIGTTAYVIISPNEEEQFTEFYILGLDDQADDPQADNPPDYDYPREMVVGEGEEVNLVIVNHEQETTSYKVEVWIGGDQVNVRLGEAEMDEIQTGPLAHEDKWEQEIGFAALDPSISTTLSAPVIEGQQILIVTGVDGFEVGDYIQIIGPFDDELVQIEDIDVTNSEILINTELKYEHSEGEPVEEKQRVEFRLFRDGDIEPHLILHLYVDVSPA